MEITLGKSLKEGGKQYDQYHGLRTIAEICSGDVSALLEIYWRIFKEGKVAKDKENCIAKHIQHKAIESVSRKFLEQIKDYQPFGEKMYKMVLSFGTLCRKILVDGYWVTSTTLIDNTQSLSVSQYLKSEIL